jgi:hypothetical protein
MATAATEAPKRARKDMGMFVSCGPASRAWVAATADELGMTRSGLVWMALKALANDLKVAPPPRRGE